VVSALQKALRRGLQDEALFWSTELDTSGLGEWCWRRLRVIASEDVGLAEPGLAAEVRALYENWRDAKGPRGDTSQGQLFLVHAVLLLARAQKSRIVDHALIVHYRMAEEGIRDRDIPDVALDKHTLAGKKRGRGWPHFWRKGTLLADRETGELSEAPTLPDHYRERAEAATTRPAA
jgi:replication-associated recombination protein RarA